ncbi:MAG TPA: hypothetical protein VK612_02905 [Pyrinomonadaceae bacterium]|nr:hypothetical protein [Pyrinomonadaceae bacterium]
MTQTAKSLERGFGETSELSLSDSSSLETGSNTIETVSKSPITEFDYERDIDPSEYCLCPEERFPD